MNPRVAAMAASGLLALAAGCVVIPVNYHAAGSRTNVSTQTAGTLQIGVTTKEEVLLRLGEPDVCSEDELIYVYGWTKVGAIWILATPQGAAGGELGKSFALKLTFDATQRLTEVELLREFWSSHSKL